MTSLQLTLLLVLMMGSATLALLLTPLARLLAGRFGLVDKPDGRRKLQREAIPVAGGLAILVSSVLTLGIGLLCSPLLWKVLSDKAWSLLGLLVGAVLICAVGVADDFLKLRARHKVLGQLAAILVVMGFGVRVESFHVFGWHVDLGLLALPFTMFWLLGAINSLNLIDGMDGFLGSVGSIIALGLAALAALHGFWDTAVVALVLSGAILGFLRYNLPPASIYLGDGGSMLIGLVIGVLAIQSSLKGPATIALAAPAALLIIPILDSSAAIVRRKLTGWSIYSTDRGHLHHCLQRRGLSKGSTLLLVAGLSLFTMICTLASQAFNNELLALLSALIVAATLVLTGLFGHGELQLVRQRVGALLRSLLVGRDPSQPQQAAVHLQGSADWEEVWGQVTACAQELQLKSACLNVNLPALHEGYHARWESPAEVGADQVLWRTSIPLSAQGQSFGSLELSGLSDEEPVWNKIARMARIIESIEQAAGNLAESVVR
jgi:UDP-GlcNAc:undecaprenyl-phosphate GlcNAc-1-phosphate transferase